MITHPDLLTIIISAISGDQVQLIDTEVHNMHTKLQEILRNQSEIGWRKFRLGFWKTAWRAVQKAYAKERGKKQMEIHGIQKIKHNYGSI